MNFNNHFSFKQYKKLSELYTIKESNEQYARPCKEFYNELTNFATSLVNYLKERNQNVGLKKIQYGEGHSTYFQDCWNKVVNKEHNDNDDYIEHVNTQLASRY